MTICAAAARKLPGDAEALHNYLNYKDNYRICGKIGFVSQKLGIRRSMFRLRFTLAKLIFKFRLHVFCVNVKSEADRQRLQGRAPLAATSSQRR